MIQTIVDFSALALALMIAIIGHEIMHALTAYYYKDDTAKLQGRLSINPIKHIDIVGTIIFPLFLYLSQKMAGVENPIIFGWAKPVPINMQTVIKNGGLLGAFNVSMAGIIYNFFMAFISAMLIKFFFDPQGFIDTFMFLFLYYLILYNIVLMVFNLLPIPPLDGANALRYIFIKFRLYKVVEFFDSIERFGIIILLIILVTPLSTYIVNLPIYMIFKFLINF